MKFEYLKKLEIFPYTLDELNLMEAKKRYHYKTLYSMWLKLKREEGKKEAKRERAKTWRLKNPNYKKEYRKRLEERLKRENEKRNNI